MDKKTPENIIEKLEHEHERQMIRFERLENLSSQDIARVFSANFVDDCVKIP